jgi:hypothetical protein
MFAASHPVYTEKMSCCDTTREFITGDNPIMYGLILIGIGGVLAGPLPLLLGLTFQVLLPDGVHNISDMWFGGFACVCVIVIVFAVPASIYYCVLECYAECSRARRRAGAV